MQYPVIDIKKTGKNIETICKQKNISVKRIQNYLQLACPQTIYRWFCGKALPSVDNFFALSKLLEMPMEKLIIQTKVENFSVIMDVVYNPDKILIHRRILSICYVINR